MAFSLKHLFVSAKADGIDPTQVKPSDWNAEHDLNATAPGLLGRTDAGAGPLSLLPLTAFQFLPGMAWVWMGSEITVPDGWLIMGGQLLVRATYPELFAAIGTKFDTGVDSSHFRLPDLRGRVIAGVDVDFGSGFASRLTSAIITPDGHELGGVGGIQRFTITEAQMPAHTHEVIDPGHKHALDMTRGGLGGTGSGQVVQNVGPAETSTEETGISVGSTGGSEIHPNVQPTFLAYWIIKT